MNAVSDTHHDVTSPLPPATTDAGSVTALLPQAAAPKLSREAERMNIGPAVGPGAVLRQRYVLERELGSGGMGVVYRALDRNKRDLPEQHRHVALKVLREEFSSRPDALLALRREAHHAQSLSHPGIVNVFDFDRDGDVYFITMELLEGELLSDLLQRTRPGKLPRDAAVRVLRDIGSAVAYAHERGVLHMDLKPGNVMITTQGEVRVLDFGLAHPNMREPWISDGSTAFHAATPTYASCERLDGLAPEARDDVFSFACMAYELLSGEHPFGRRPARQARDEGRRLRRVRGLSRRQWHALRSGLAWARTDRPLSLVELLDGLELVPAAQQGPPAGRLKGRRGARARQSPAWFTAAGLGILAAACYLAWLEWGPDRSPADATTTPEVSMAPAPLPAAPPRAPEQSDQQPVIAESVATDASPAALDVATSLGATPAPAPIVTYVGPGRLQFDAETVTVDESESALRLRVSRRGGTDGTISFGWRTIADSAKGDQDFAALGAAVETMAPGQASATLLVPIVSDGVRESIELFDVVIEDPTGGATLGEVTQVTVIIVDDD